MKKINMFTLLPIPLQSTPQHIITVAGNLAEIGGNQLYNTVSENLHSQFYIWEICMLNIKKIIGTYSTDDRVT